MRSLVDMLHSALAAWRLGFRVQGSGFRVQGSGCEVQGSGFRVQGPGFGNQGAGCRVQGSGFRVHGSGYRVQGSGFRVQDSGFRVHGTGIRVQGSGYRVWNLGEVHHHGRVGPCLVIHQHSIVPRLIQGYEFTRGHLPWDLKVTMGPKPGLGPMVNDLE